MWNEHGERDGTLTIWALSIAAITIIAHYWAFGGIQ